MAKRPRENKTEHNMARSLDQLAAFERYQAEVGDLLREAVEKGWSPEQMRKHPRIQALLEARKITIALTDPDSSRALAAIKDHSDRIEGKSVERRENVHKYEKLDDEALDSLVLSEMASMAEDETH